MRRDGGGLRPLWRCPTEIGLFRNARTRLILLYLTFVRIGSDIRSHQINCPADCSADSRRLGGLNESQDIEGDNSEAADLNCLIAW
jgi:hypothetical protein